MQQHLTDFSRGESVADRGTHVHCDLVVGAEGGQRGQRHDRPVPAGETGPRPDLAPRVAGDEVLKGRGELGGVRYRAVHVFVAQDGAACRITRAQRRVPGDGPRTVRRAEVLQQEACDLAGPLDRGEVCRVPEHLEPGPGDTVGDRLCVFGWDGRIVAPGDDQRRRGDASEIGAQIHGGDRLAALRVGLRIGAPQHGHERRHQAGVAGREARCHPALDDCLGDRAQPVASHRGGTGEPGLRGRQVGRRAEQSQPGDPLRMVRGDPHGRHPAEGQTGQVDAGDAQIELDPVQHGQDVASQLVDRARLAGLAGLAGRGSG